MKMKIQSNISNYNRQTNFKANFTIPGGIHSYEIAKKNWNPSRLFNVKGAILVADESDEEGQALISAKRIFELFYNTLKPEDCMQDQTDITNTAQRIANSPHTLPFEHIASS